MSKSHLESYKSKQTLHFTSLIHRSVGAIFNSSEKLQIIFKIIGLQKIDRREIALGEIIFGNKHFTDMFCCLYVKLATVQI